MELFLGKIGKPGPRLAVVAPIIKAGVFSGAVFGVADLTSLKLLLQKLVHDDDAWVSLVDSQGMVALSTKADFNPLQPYSLPPGGALQSLGNGLSHWIPDSHPGLSPYKRWLASLYVAERQLEGHPGWRLVVESPLKPPLTAISEKITRVLAGIGALLVALVLCSRLFAGRIAAVVSDFERLTRELPEQISAGAVIAWPAPSTCELQGLTENVQLMARELQLSHSDLRRLAERIDKVAEQERASLAQEIHDELGQLLAALMVDMAWFQKRVPEGDEKYVAKVKAVNELLSTTISCARRITRDLRPRILDELGLVAAIEEQLDLYRQRQIECHFMVQNQDIEIDVERSNSLFRIFQESMTNILRHSGATAADIVLDIGKDGIVLEVHDNGCGITEERKANLQSLGLLGIKERALRWGGTATITGVPGHGTTIRVELPSESRRRLG